MYHYFSDYVLCFEDGKWVIRIVDDNKKNRTNQDSLRTPYGELPNWLYLLMLNKDFKHINVVFSDNWM